MCFGKKPAPAAAAPADGDPGDEFPDEEFMPPPKPVYTGRENEASYWRGEEPMEWPDYAAMAKAKAAKRDGGA